MYPHTLLFKMAPLKVAKICTRDFYSPKEQGLQSYQMHWEL